MPVALALIEAVVDEALLLPPDKRRDHITRRLESAGDRLAATSRLALMEGAMSFLVTAGWAAEDAGSLQAGERIGAWAVEQFLGSGGMGEVYRARRADGHYDQAAAIKLTRVEADEGYRQFEAERQTLARLEHPNIARLIDGGRAGDGRHFMVVELIDGIPIDHHADQQGLGLQDRVRLIQAACDGVAHAHSRLVLHRDIKPANLLVTPRGELKLIDFGVATSLEAAEGEAAARLPLTRAFAAPEQWDGGRVSVAADIFALGATLTQLATGQPPRRAADGAASLPEDAVLPRDLRAILERCLAIDPAQRYASVDALATDLQNFLDRAPVEARNGGAGYRFARWVDRHRLGAGLAAAFLVSLVAGLTASTGFALRANAEAERANTLLGETEILFEASEYSGRLGAAQAQALLSVFNSADSDSLDPDFVRNQLVEYSQDNLAYIEEYPDDVAYSLVAIGSIFLRRNDYTAMLAILEPARDLTLSVAQLNAERDALLARAYMGVGRNAEAVPLLRSALAAELARDPDYYASPSHASSVSSLAVASGSLTDRQTAIAVLEDAIVRDQEVTGCFWCPFLYNEKGVHHSALGDFAAAAVALEQSVAVQMQVDPTRRAATDRALMNAAHLRYFALGDVAGARTALETIQAIADDTKGPSAILAEARVLEAEIALAEGRPDAGLQFAQAAEDMFAEFGGAPDSHKHALGPLRIQLLAQSGRIEDAREELIRVEALEDDDAVRRQRLRGELYLALAAGDASAATALRDAYAVEVAQLGAGDYLGRYRLAQIDRMLNQN